MQFKKATLSQRASAFGITWMLTFSVSTISANYAKTAPLLYITIVLSYILILLFFYAKGSSPGKYILRIQVFSSIDNKPTNFLKMFLRETIGKLISSIFYLGFIYAFFNEEQLALHDVIFKTYVVQIRPDSHT